MALLIPAALATYGAYSLAKTYDSRSEAVQNKVNALARRTPTSNRWNHASKTQFIQYRQPVDVIPDIDVHGVPRYLVDYGSGALTVQYTTPEFIAGNLTHY